MHCTVFNAAHRRNFLRRQRERDGMIESEWEVDRLPPCSHRRARHIRGHVRVRARATSVLCAPRHSVLCAPLHRGELL